jgi:hypothetical protein
MPKSTTPVATTTTLAGKSAKELRALVDAKEVTAKAVIAHLSAKESLRAPSQALLDELKGVAKAAPAKAAPAKAEPPKAAAPAKADKALADLTARVAALEAALAALAAPAPAAKAAPKVAAAKAAKDTAAKDTAKAVALAELLADESDEVTEADMRDDLAGRSLADLREQAAACEIEGAARMGKAALVEALVEDSILAGVIVAAPAPAAKAAPKVAAKAGKAADEVVF